MAYHKLIYPSDYTVDVEVLEDGRKLRGQILFNDLVVEPAVGDYTKFKIDFFNSYDASWAFSQQASGLRLWCLNGCTTPDTAARSRYKHTASINVEGQCQQNDQRPTAFHVTQRSVAVMDADTSDRQSG